MRHHALLALSLLSQAVVAQIPGLEPQKVWDFGGYIKPTLISHQPESGRASTDLFLHNRINLAYYPDDAFSVNLALRNRLLVSDTRLLPSVVSGYTQDSGIVDMSTNWYESGRSVGNSQFDRFYLQWQPGKEISGQVNNWQIKAGRFRINWGMNRVWNPNDVFNSYSLFEFDYAEKPGSDALLLNRALGFASGLDLVLSPEHDGEQEAGYAVRYLFNHTGWDGQLIAGRVRDDVFFGLGTSGSVQEAALRAEVTHFNYVANGQQSSNDSESALELSAEKTVVASIEADYSFASERNWMLTVALLYSADPQSAPSTSLYLSRPLNARTLSFTRYTAYADLGFDLSPLSHVTTSIIWYQDDSFYLSLAQNYSLADDWQLLGVLQRYDGGGDSLFGSQPNSVIYAQICWDF